jgi:LPXTG-site transpeptidase (sortase) family protein
LALAIVIPCVAVFSLRDNEPPRYELEAVSGEIDFTAPDIVAHTAADGIAVVGVLWDNESISPALIPTAARFTSDPATIWQNETTPTHGGFTLPVLMVDGESIGVLNIPDIGLSVRVYEAEDSMEAMERGVAHFRHTSAWMGNVGLSAHNINLDGTPGYFLNIHMLKQGAVILYETTLGTRIYAVESIREISEMDWSMLERTQDNRLTLITCITGKPHLRLAVQAVEIQR